MTFLRTLKNCRKSCCRHSTGAAFPAWADYNFFCPCLQYFFRECSVCKGARENEFKSFQTYFSAACTEAFVNMHIDRELAVFFLNVRFFADAVYKRTAYSFRVLRIIAAASSKPICSVTSRVRRFLSESVPFFASSGEINMPHGMRFASASAYC